jgi:hypothetical protein
MLAPPAPCWRGSWPTKHDVRSPRTCVAAQRQVLKEYASMAEEFGFRILDGKKSVDAIQDELRRQVGAFLAQT